jgi:hypothetical protein
MKNRKLSIVHPQHTGPQHSAMRSKGEAALARKAMAAFVVQEGERLKADIRKGLIEATTTGKVVLVKNPTGLGAKQEGYEVHPIAATLRGDLSSWRYWSVLAYNCGLYLYLPRWARYAVKAWFFIERYVLLRPSSKGN